MKFNFRKIASAGASTLMLGSTIALAAAANYPAPFVSGGVADVGLVYGSSGANTDLVAASDISINLQSSITNVGSTTIEGESYPLFTSSSPLLLNASINSVRSSATETNLPTILRESTFTAVSGASSTSDIKATHYVYPGANPRVIFAKEPTSSDNPQAGIFYSTTAGNYLYNSTVIFNKEVNFTHEDTKGETIELFGQEFTVASATDATDLVLLRAAEKIFLDSEGNPSQTIVVDGNSYTVELVSASDTAATIRLTDSSGETAQKEINEAASSTILGVEVAVDTADETNFKLSASVIIGTSKVTLIDGSEVLVGSNEDPIEGTNVDFWNSTAVGTSTTDVNRITIQVFADSGSEDFIAPGNSLTDPVFNNMGIIFAGLANDDDREDIVVDVSGNDKMTVSFDNWQENSLSGFGFINNESNAWGTSFLGDSNEWRIFTRENEKINESAYAVVGNEDEGYLVRLRTITNTSGSPIYTNDKVVFENAFDTTQYWESNSFSAEGTGEITIAGQVYSLIYEENNDDNVDGDQYVRLDYPDSSGETAIFYPTVQTSKGAKVAFYEPLIVKATQWDGTTNMSNMLFPDGDGFTTITVTAGGIDNVWTIGGRSVNLTSTLGSAFDPDGSVGLTSYVTAGPVTYNITAGIAAGNEGTAGLSNSTVTKFLNDTIVITLMDPTSNTSIYTPGLIVFEEQDDANNYNAVIVQSGGSGDTNNGIGVSATEFTWAGDRRMTDGAAYGNGFQREDNDDFYQKMDIWGTLVTIDQSTSDQYTTTISYPSEQVVAEVYVAEADASTGGGGALGSVTVMDSEVSKVSANNLIVIGGSCINTVAASLLGSGDPICGVAFESTTGIGDGSFLIQTFTSPFSGSKVATLVAGYNAADTINAAKALTTQTVDTSVGKKYTGSSASSIELVA